MKKHPYDFTKDEGETPCNQADAEYAEGSVETEHTERRSNPCSDDCPNWDPSELDAKRAMAEAEEIRLRALAEADNARKRLLREKDEAVRFAASAVLSDIIPSLDNLDLALEHAKGNAACKDFFVGVEMTRKLLMEALQKHGLSQVGAVGEIFDPAIHEAMSLVQDPAVPDGAISALMTRGYKLHDRLLRPAKVIVAKN